MSILITTELTPYSISRNIKSGSASLHIIVKNMSNEDKLTSIEVRTGRGLSITRGGLVREKSDELGIIKGRGEIDMYTDIYPTYNASPGYEKILITVFEHYNDFQHVLKSYQKEMAIRIE